MPTTTDRPLRLCTACGGLDDHPRHVIGVPPGTPNAVPPKEWFDALGTGVPASALVEALNPTGIVRHIDCCAAAGCLICQETEKVTAGARGQDLIDTIANGALDGFEPPEIASNKELGIDG